MLWKQWRRRGNRDDPDRNMFPNLPKLKKKIKTKNGTADYYIEIELDFTALKKKKIYLEREVVRQSTSLLRESVVSDTTNVQKSDLYAQSS